MLENVYSGKGFYLKLKPEAPVRWYKRLAINIWQACNLTPVVGYNYIRARTDLAEKLGIANEYVEIIKY